MATLSVHLRCLLPRTAACRHWRHLQTDDQHFLGFECFGSAVAKLEQAIRVIDGAVTGSCASCSGFRQRAFRPAAHHLPRIDAQPSRRSTWCRSPTALTAPDRQGATA